MNRRGRAFDLLLLYFLYASVWVGVSESTLSTALNSARRMFVALKEKKKEKKNRSTNRELLHTTR